jgi:hypothetical protein
MGAYPLEDHKLIHRHLGINQLVAFDLDKNIVARQTFNRPIETCYCLHKESGDLISNLDSILKDCSFTSNNGIIIWLDYTDPKKIAHQFQEFQALLGKLRTGDLVRITVNAHPHSLLNAQSDGDQPMQAAQRRDNQFKNLSEKIGDFLPSGTSADQMTRDELPRIISRALGAAALKVLPATGENTFCPLSIIRYADGVQMLSVTGTVTARKDVDEMLTKIDLEAWPFASVDWSKVHPLLVPVLTVRERLMLERGILNKSADDLVTELGFDSASDIQMAEFLESYKSYYRFYPTLISSDI